MTEVKKLSKDEVRKIAKLARLKLSEQEVGKFQGQLVDILSYIDMLNEVDISGVEPTAQTTDMINNFREDMNRASLTASEAVSQAVRTQGNHFKVKAVFTQE